MPHIPNRTENHTLILNVDDTEAIRYTRSRVLTQAGYRVIETSNGEETLLMAATLDPHLIVLDVNLPGIDGLEVCRRLKADPHTSRIMVLQVSSARGSKLDVVAGLEGGADGYLIEPIDPLELLATVRALLRLAHREDENVRLIRKLSRSERQFVEATEAAECGLWDWDIAKGTLEWFGGHERLAGIAPGGFSGKIETFSEILHPDDRARVWDRLERAMARREERFDDEYRFVHPDGTVRWMAGSGRFVYDEAGNAVRMTGVVQDITARKEAEARQRTQRERLALLADAAEHLLSADDPAGMLQPIFDMVKEQLSLDAYFHYRVADEPSSLVLEACAGVPDEALPGLRRLDFGQALCGTTAIQRKPVVRERLHESNDEHAQAVKASGVRAYACHPLMVGERLLGTLSFASKTRDRFSSDDLVFMRTVCRYVAAAAERLRLQREAQARTLGLRAAHDTFRHLVEHSPFGVYVVDADFRLIQVSAGAQKVFEHVRPLLGRDFAEVLRIVWPEPFASEAIGRFRHTLETGEPYHAPSTVERRHDSGEVESYDWKIERITLPDGRLGVVCHFYDLSERRRYEQELAAATQRLEATLSASDVGLWHWDLSTNRLVTDRNLRKLFAMEEAEGDSIEAYLRRLHADDRARVEAAIQQAVVEGGSFDQQYRVILRDRTLRWIHARGKVERNAAGQPFSFSGVVLDITARKEAEETLKRTGEFIRRITDVAPSILYVYDLQERRNVWGNREMFDGLGYDQARLDAMAERLLETLFHPDDWPRYQAHAARLSRLADGEVAEFEYRMRHADGTWRWLYSRDMVFKRADDGSVKQIAGAALDITERKRAEQELARLAAIVQSSEDAIISIDRERIITSWNHGAERLYGYTAEEAAGRPIALLIPPERHDEERRIFARILAGVPIEHYETVRRRKDGTLLDVSLTISPIRNEQGAIVGASKIARDITDRKRAERALAEQQQLLKSITDNADMALFIMDERQRCIFMNPAAERLTGFTLDQVPERPLHEFVHHTRPDGTPYPLSECPIDRAFPEANRVQGEEVFVHKDGRFYHVAFTASPLHDRRGRPVGTIIEVQDITERKRQEAALLESESFYRQTLESIPGMVFTSTPDGACDYVSDQWVEFTGVPAAEQLGSGWVQVVHPDDRERAYAAWRTAVEGRGEYDLEYRVRRRDGGYEWFKVRGRAIRDERGAIARWFGTAVNIDALKQVEEALRERERFLSTVTGSARVGLVMVEKGYVYRFANEAYAAIFDLPTDRIVGRHVYEVLPHAWTQIQPRLDRAFAGERVSYELILPPRPGEKDDRYYAVSYEPHVDQKGQHTVIVVVVDISERRRQEEELRRWKDELEVRVQERTRELQASQERLMALASQLSLTEQRERRKLARDLHDYLAQMLVVGQMKTSQGRKQAVLPPVTERVMEDVDKIFQQALTYTRTLIAELSPPSLHESGLPAALKWLGERFQKDGLWVDVQSNTDLVPLSEEHAVMVFQSVRELLFNVLKHSGVDRAHVTVTLDDDRLLRVAVVDRGKGLAPAVLQRSEPGHLGLASLRERLAAIGGRLDVQSKPGEGTTGTISLPLAARTPSDELRVTGDEPTVRSVLREQVNPSDHSSLVTGHPSPAAIRVLLVDDHKLVRQGLRDVLTAHDRIRVVGEAGDAEEALMLAANLKPDVALMDVNMPKMNGVEATKRLKQLYPETVVVGISVHTDAHMRDAMVKAGAETLLAKECAADELYQAIVHSYDARRHSSPGIGFFSD